MFQNATLTPLIDEEKESSFQEGFKQGEEEGYKRAKEEFFASFKLLHKLAEKLFEEKKHLIETLKPEIIEFSMAICERVLRQELSQPEKMARLIDSLISLISPTLTDERVKISFHPEDLIMLEKKLKAIEFDHGEIKPLKFCADPGIERGDIVIDTEKALLHFSISRELEDLQTKVLRRNVPL